jgi:hypothetical protein
MKTLLDLFRFSPQIAYGGDTGGGGGGGGSSSSDSGSSSSSSSTPTRTEQQVQDDINKALKDSGGAWTSELNDLVAERDDARAGTTTTTTTTTSSSSSKPTTTTTSSSSSSSDDNKSSLTKGNTIGQVSKNGQYAGDGFEWVETTTSGGSEFLTRTYTGAGKDNGLGQDTIFGNTAQKDMKETIAKISLDEGSAFASSPASATDIPANDFGIPTGFFPASGSYAEQVGQADYTPTVQYGDSEPASTKTFAETFAEERSKQGDGGTFTYEGKEYTTDLAPIDTSKPLTSSIRPEVRPEPEPVETGPAFDYTGVSMGELGRGAPEGTESPGTVNYEVGTDPEMEMLVSLKNKDPNLLKSGEYLAASQYEKDKEERTELPGSVKTASAGPLDNLLETLFPSEDPGLTDDDLGLPSEPVDFSEYDLSPFGGAGPEITPTVTDNEAAMSAQEASFDQPETEVEEPSYFDRTLEALKNVAIGIPKNVSDMVTGLGDYADVTTSSRGPGIASPTALLAQEILMRTGAGKEAVKQNILNQPADTESPTGNILGGIGDLVEKGADAIENYFYPEGDRSQAVFTSPGADPRELDLVQVSGPKGDEIQGAINVAAEEGAGGGITDTLLQLNPVTRILSAGLNVGEGFTGLRNETDQLVDQLYNEGKLQDNKVFQDTLKAQGGDVEAAKKALSNAAFFDGSGKIAAISTGDALVPKIGKGVTGVAKDVALRAGTEGVQGGLESMTARSSLSDILNLTGDNRLDITENLAGAVATELMSGTGQAPVSIATSALTSRGDPELSAIANANQAAQNQAAGIGTFAPAATTAVAQPVQTAPEVQTTVGGLNVMASPTFGELAMSNVPTSYDPAIGTDSPVALLQGPKPTTSMDVMAAAEIIDNQIAETGTVAPEVLTNLQTATGLSMAELNNIASSSPSVTGTPRTSDLTDEPTGIGGGSNISVVPLPSGETLLRNNVTGRETVVNEGANLSEAIQVFDEVSTPFEAPAAETAPDIGGIATALPEIDMGVISQLNQAANLDTAPVLPGQDTLPTLANNVQLASAPAAEDGSVTIDRGTPAVTDDPGSDVGGLEGEILQGEVGPAEDVVEDEGMIIDVDAVEDADQITDQTVVDVDSSIPPVKTATTVPVSTDTDSAVAPLTEVEPPLPPLPPEEPVVGEPDDDGGVTVDLPADAPTFVPPVTFENDDGETETRCPDGYQEVEGPNGLICQKSVEKVRMRAGRSLQPYTRLRIPEGYRGPGQRRKTVTTTERAEPITT